ncbi:MAG TPA: hypothetical protein VM121_07770 [Acidimicrobiales bacterium]|nr:hypothetical protein [Acidimicrobiales bacterium]
MQLALLRREQGRPAEAELAARELGPGVGATAVRAAILVDLGRDSEAWAELTTWSTEEDGAPAAATEDDDDNDRDRLAETALFGEVAAVLADNAVARSLYERLLPYEDRFAYDSAGGACHGSISRQLGLLAHRIDEWEVARGHFEAAVTAHAEAVAPILLAHTYRQYAALLRVRGGPTDWDRAVELLAAAEEIYRRLGIGWLASQCQSVLARSDLTDAAAIPGAPRAVNVFRRRSDGDGWLVRYNGSEAKLDDERGLQDLAHLLVRSAQSLHVADLLLGSARQGVGTAATTGVASPWRSGGGARLHPLAVLDGAARQEHRARLSDLGAEADRARRGREPISAALAEGERDLIEALLAQEGDSLELAREAVSTRIRIGVDTVERVHPELGRHLRRSIRTGTFCSYEPPSRTTWET